MLDLNSVILRDATLEKIQVFLLVHISDHIYQDLLVNGKAKLVMFSSISI